MKRLLEMLTSLETYGLFESMFLEDTSNFYDAEGERKIGGEDANVMRNVNNNNGGNNNNTGGSGSGTDEVDVPSYLEHCELRLP